MFPEWGEIPFLLMEEKMNKTILKIEVNTQDKFGKTRNAGTVHGPGPSWGNLVADELSFAGVPGGDRVALTIWYTNNTTSYEYFTW